MCGNINGEKQTDIAVNQAVYGTEPSHNLWESLTNSIFYLLGKS